MVRIGFHPFTKRREVAEARELVGKIERIPGAPREAADRYYTVDLIRLTELGQRHPHAVKKLLERSLAQSPHPKETEPFYRLVEAAQGDARALLETFARSDLKTKLALFRITLYSPHVGDGHLVGEFFVKLMETSTPKEREEWVEPTLNSVLNRGAWAANPRVQNKMSWLKALYHGWKKERKDFEADRFV